ncbi:MAG: WYL domain-containing transcriptional regulator [Actinobacteria bacterium]|nr:WYL domain-containing transcriptional regulator [Actinomycetota bacterium]
MKVSNIWRLLREILIICRYGKVKAKKIAEEIEISVRQVYRDMECLKLAKVPISSDRNGYFFTDNFFMPRISLDLPEALTLVIFINSIKAQKGTPYYNFLNSACEKIINLLPGNLKKMISESAIDGMVDFGLEAKVDYKEIGDVFSAVYSAKLERKSISVTYFSMERKKIQQRIIDPYALIFRFGVWYLIGHCHLRDEIRTFRIDRIKSAKVIENRFEIPSTFSIDKFLEGSWGIIKGEKKEKVKLKFSPELAMFISEVKWHPSQKLEFLGDGSLLASYEVAGLDEIKRWILGFGKEVEVLEPEELRKEIEKETEEIRKIYSPMMH